MGGKRWQTWVLAVALLLLAIRLPSILAGPAEIDLSNYDFERNNGGRLFLLRQEGEPDIYLFGTFHVSDPRVLAVPKAVEDALEAAPLYFAETRNVPGAGPYNEHAEAYRRRQEEWWDLCTGGVPLRIAVSDELFDETLQAMFRLTSFGSHGFYGESALAPLTPWCVSTILRQTQAEWARQYEGTLVLDDELLRRAMESGKRVVRLETAAAQASPILEMPIGLQLEELRRTLENFGFSTMEGAVETTLTDYLDGRFDTTNSWGLSDDYWAYFWREMVIRRNLGMVRTILANLEDQPAFVAAGLAHLIGEKGLVALLEEEGYEATVLEPPR